MPGTPQKGTPIGNEPYGCEYSVGGFAFGEKQNQHWKQTNVGDTDRDSYRKKIDQDGEKSFARHSITIIGEARLFPEGKRHNLGSSIHSHFSTTPRKGATTPPCVFRASVVSSSSSSGLSVLSWSLPVVLTYHSLCSPRESRIAYHIVLHLLVSMWHGIYSPRSGPNMILNADVTILNYFFEILKRTFLQSL